MRYSILLATFALAGCAKPAWQDAVERQLVDPSSAQFRDVVDRGGIVCGEVNAKNRMGGYVGFVPFHAIDGKAEIEPSDVIVGSYDEKVDAATAKVVFVVAHSRNCPNAG